MPSVNLDEAEHYGKVSTLPRNREAPRTCRVCGSSLAGRYRGVRFIGGKPKRVWVCGCKHARYLPVEAAADPCRTSARAVAASTATRAGTAQTP